MNPALRGYSFHSVKGGVGKSTLSTLAALALADAYPKARVYLVDMDLTGTSLADVLPLEAPRWEGVRPEETIDVRARPDGFHDHAESRERIEQRGASEEDASKAVGVPYLNDYLLFSPRKGEEASDIDPVSIAWRFSSGPENLRVFPSSALPRDLVRALPVIYDEEHAAFLESRLEYLLAALLAQDETCIVVFDTPPTIPGLSRSVLNLAFRLSSEPKTPLSADGFMPRRLEQASVDWRAFLVATQDFQDIRAAARWLDLPNAGRPDILRLVLNRVGGDMQQREALHRAALSDSLNPLVLNPLWVEERVDLREIFRSEHTPPLLRELLHTLDEAP